MSPALSCSPLPSDPVGRQIPHVRRLRVTETAQPYPFGAFRVCACSDNRGSRIPDLGRSSHGAELPLHCAGPTHTSRILVHSNSWGIVGKHWFSLAPESQTLCVYPAFGAPGLRANDACFARSHSQKTQQFLLRIKTKGLSGSHRRKIGLMSLKGL